MSDIRLKRCPFCGGEAEMYNGKDCFGKFWYIRCKGCYSRGSGSYESVKELKPNEEQAAIQAAWENAIKAWNLRIGWAE